MNYRVSGDKVHGLGADARAHDVQSESRTFVYFLGLLYGATLE